MNNIIANGSIDFSKIPVVETSRLRLRGHRLNDLDPLARIWAKPETTKFIGGKPRSRSDLWQQIQRAIGCWAILGYGYWVIEAIDTGECIGELGFMEGLRDVVPSFTGTPEAGWVIDPSHWGHGYASEALEAALQWRDVNVKAKRTVCIIEPEHTISIHIAEKHGFKMLGETHIGPDPILVFERMT